MQTSRNMIYLASKSPRRQELLEQIHVPFEVLDVPQQDPVHADMVDESILAGEPAYDYVKRMALSKAEYAWQFLVGQHFPQHPLLTADTTVVLENTIIGKPGSPDEAFDMLSRLSGKTHQVLTSVAVKWHDGLFQSVQTSHVTFAKLSEKDILSYISTGEPFDKAGGYGIQGLAGQFISHIDGSYSGIMGLPLYETCQLLKKAGILPA